MSESIKEIIRKAGGIVHSDGNIFFTNADLFMAAARAALTPAAPPVQAPAPAATVAADPQGGAKCPNYANDGYWLDHAGDDKWKACAGTGRVAATVAAVPPAKESFDQWLENPYTKALQASIENDYVPKQGAASPPVPAAEPVAWAVFAPNGNIRLWSQDSEHVRAYAAGFGFEVTPLYAPPPAPAENASQRVEVGRLVIPSPRDDDYDEPELESFYGRMADLQERLNPANRLNLPVFVEMPVDAAIAAQAKKGE